MVNAKQSNINWHLILWAPCWWGSALKWNSSWQEVSREVWRPLKIKCALIWRPAVLQPVCLIWDYGKRVSAGEGYEIVESSVSSNACCWFSTNYKYGNFFVHVNKPNNVSLFPNRIAWGTQDLGSCAIYWKFYPEKLGSIYCLTCTLIYVHLCFLPISATGKTFVSPRVVGTALFSPWVFCDSLSDKSSKFRLCSSHDIEVC